MNGRLDTFQAAILLEKLKIFDEEIAARDRVATRYSDALGDIVSVPHVIDGATSAWAQYTIQLDHRETIAAELKQRGVPTAVYYPRHLAQQPAYKDFPVAPGGLPMSDSLSARVLSLPMHPYLDPATQDRVVEAVREAIGDPASSTRGSAKTRIG
jgi:dTDP-4-amino-4,6-dideoxygalactose transaminase